MSATQTWLGSNWSKSTFQLSIRRPAFPVMALDAPGHKALGLLGFQTVTAHYGPYALAAYRKAFAL
jgi:hypothetical protein